MLVEFYIKNEKLKRKALVIGSTGATGKALVQQLKANDSYEFVNLLHYKPTGLADNLKVKEHIQSFDKILDFRLDNIDDVFCCIGTTMKKVGSKEIFSKVDKDYVVDLAKWAKIDDIQSFHVISYLGADKNSSVFYSRVKGEMEDALKKLNLRSLYIYHPPILKANRGEFRLGEIIGVKVLTFLSPFMIGPLRKYRPLAVEKMASSMIYNGIHNKPGVYTVSSEEMQI